MAASAIIPRNEKEPTGSARKVVGAQNNFKRRLNAIFNGINKLIKGLEYETININHRFIVLNQMNVETYYKYNQCTDTIEAIPRKRRLNVNEVVYRYDMDANGLNQFNQVIEDMINRLLMVDEQGNLVRADNGRQLWFMTGYVDPSYRQGTNQAFTNLSLQSDVYASAVQSADQIFFSPQYQRRIGLVAGKENRVIQGFTDDMVKDTTTILSDGILIGKSPREISKEIQSRIGAGQSKANLIAATEIPGALRQANRDEGKQASIDFGIDTAYLWMSAFKSTSRAWHISRSGEFHSAKEDEDFYDTGGNRFNCYCTQILTVMQDGKPLSDTAQKKVQGIKADYRKDNPA